MQVGKSTTDTVNHLNSLLRGEISAVETYRQALNKLDRTTYRSTLEDCARSHELRVQLLRDEVLRRGGQPAQGSGAWGSFAKLVEGAATKLGDKAAIAALEEGEDHGRNDYRRELDELDEPAKQFVQSQVLPEQNRTHDAMSMLKKSLS